MVWRCVDMVAGIWFLQLVVLQAVEYQPINKVVHFRRICSQGVVCSQISHSQSDVCKSISACDDVLPRTLEAIPHCCFGRKVKALPGVFLMTW